MDNKLYGTEITDRKNAICSIFPNAKNLYVTHTYARFKIEHSQLSFDDLKKLSELCSTNNINFDDGDRSDGCETCGHGAYSNIEITVTWN